MLEILKRIEALREELHNAIDKGNADEILQKSRELDEEILKLINSGSLLKNKPSDYQSKFGESL
ncbi:MULTISPECIES: aspartyl-phosphate phosphatase Spo0E family protein [Oscillospiraceae]|uniref:Sporulation stage 0, Spo0E-like regulatory phosphatase n=1 Tax=Pseudobacteroides cellulosolvens ATCC 35603 = DSM 2933 TaxID=398512 RepID=A0A0L6JT98_9FIRM|nr:MULTISPECIES: aspartyl-phosphate phosphatase Spo0E family protein [Oscillospiraceae]KNY29076.1 Sporulation stage 0, Spo0E-like regulatory phosphatase [Pseudobacteroides cellulosolvens ATCC 35603 = DSM 2933]